MANHPKPPGATSPTTPSQWVGANVRHLRETRDPKMTQGELAEAMSARGFAMDAPKVSRLENSRETRVDVDRLVALASVFDVNPDRLLRDPEQLDLAIFDRLVRRWRSLAEETLTANTQAARVMDELHSIASRSEEMHRRLQEELNHQPSVAIMSRESKVDPSSSGYESYLQELLIGHKVYLFYPPLNASTNEEN